jgi:hypothetical protein
MSESVFTSLKFLSLAIGSVSGIVGLFFDFRDKKSKKITKGGYVIVGLIVFTGTLALILQYKEIEDGKEKAVTENKKYAITIGLIQKQLKRTDTLLKDVNRSISPLKELSIELDFVIPLRTMDSVLQDPSYLHYRKRIEAAGDAIQNKHMQGFFFQESDKIFPDPIKEIFMRNLLSNYTVNVDIYEHSNYNMLLRGPIKYGEFSFFLFFPPGENQVGTYRSFFYHNESDAIEIRLKKNVPADDIMLDGNIESVLDLAGTTMKFRLGVGSRLTPVPYQALKAIFQSLHIKHLYLNCYGRKLNLAGFRPLYYSSLAMNYYYLFPKDISVLNKGTSVYDQ